MRQRIDRDSNFLDPAVVPFNDFFVNSDYFTRTSIFFFILLWHCPGFAIQLNNALRLDIDSKFQFITAPSSWEEDDVQRPSQFRVRSVDLKTKYELPKNLLLKCDFRFENSKAKVRKAFATLPLANTQLTAGKYSPFFSLDVDTNIDPLPGALFWSYRPVGILTKTDFNPLFLYGSVSNGSALTAEPASDHDRYNAIIDDDQDTDANDGKDISIGLELLFSFSESTRLSTMAFWGEHYLSAPDKDLISSFGGSIGEDRSIFSGVNLLFDIAAFNLTLQSIESGSQEYRRSGQMVSLAYRIKIPPTQALALQAYYSQGLNNLIKTEAVPETWNRRTITAALLFSYSHEISFLLEYNSLLYDTGAAPEDNQGIVVQMRINI